MKKIVIAGLVVLILALTVGPASAWRGHPWDRVHSHFGIFVGPPVFFAPPPPVYPRYYYPWECYDPGYRVWVQVKGARSSKIGTHPFFYQSAMHSLEEPLIPLN